MPIAWNQYIAQGVGNGTQTAWQIVDAGGFPIQMPTKWVRSTQTACWQLATR
jgi:hypothetical protein